MAAFTCSIIILNSKADKDGNCYWAFTFTDYKTGKVVNAKTSGGESNIKGIARHWNVPDDWDRSILWSSRELNIREFNRQTKDWRYAGCSPEQLALFIRKALAE